MGLYDAKNDADRAALAKLNQIKNDLNYTYARYYDQVSDKSILNYIIGIIRRPETAPFGPFPLFVEIVETILNNRTNYNINTYMGGIEKATQMYHTLFPYGEETPDFRVICVMFTGFFRANGPAAAGLFNRTLMSSFQNKQNYLEFMLSFSHDPKASECLHDILHYALAVRAFFVDDDTFTANMKHVTQKLLKAGKRSDILQAEILKVEKMAGIYDIDETDVAKTEQQLSQAKSLLNNTLGILEQADLKTEQLKRITQDSAATIQEISKRETDIITLKANTARESLNAAYNQFLDDQKQEVIFQKDILLGQLFQEAETKLSELRTMARTITSAANSELLRINTETSNALDKISHMVTDDEEIAKILHTAEENKELLERLSRLEMLDTRSIDIIARGIESQTKGSSSKDAGAEISGTTASHSDTTAPSAVTTATYTVTDSGTLPQTAPAPSVIPDVNPLLDPSIPFAERFQVVMEEKKKRIAQGEHFHAMFDDVLTILMENANPYMIGPSGCGKTYMVKQIASLLELDFIDIGYINEEYDILGFQTATGAYSTSNFYRCYKYGKIAFCDELDNSNSRATVKLNSFLSGGPSARYSFPHGEIVNRHQNFRIIAAGNTTGNGADANYNSREKIEESVQQRFTPIYVGYDNEVEKHILKDYPDWFAFVILFRQATDAWGNMNDCAAPGIFTTRDAARIKRYLDHNSLNMDKILDYEFIQTKDMEYLAFLAKHIQTGAKNQPKAKEICDLFVKKVKALREKGGLR